MYIYGELDCTNSLKEQWKPHIPKKPHSETQVTLKVENLKMPAIR